MEKFKLNTFTIILAIIAMVAILTWIVPSGKYQTVQKDGRTMVVAGSYEKVPSNPQGLFDVLTAPVEGFISAAEIIVFLLIISGVFAVVEKTGAITAGIKRASLIFASNPKLKRFFIPVTMLIFSLGGATFGMCEETLIFIPVFIALCLSLGYDSTLGVCIPYLGAAAGFAGAFANPFTLGIAQGIAGVPLYSGLGYRLIVWAISTVVVIAFVMIYAARIQKDPKKSLTYEFDIEKRKELASFDQDKDGKIRTSEILVLVTFVLGMFLLVGGVLKPQINDVSVRLLGFDFIKTFGLAPDGWYIIEISGLFLGVAALCAVFGRLSIKDASDSFFDGVRGMAEIAILLAFAKAIVIIANNGYILDTILNFMAAGISKLHPVLASWAAFLVQAVINFFIPSGSSKAVLTMPIMTPLADLIGITRQTMVLAFQFGDGWTNICIPTSPVTIAAIGLAGIPFGKWFKWILPLMVVLFIMSMILLVPPVLTNWQ
ncbi:putative ion transporter superfamily protein YfcC [Elusimicrobium simillimum]|uniref:YfcC family protein n=1 Tax=Elusimicrobium simillimum TaxID=3143438 RepID=UPI003C70394D